MLPNHETATKSLVNVFVNGSLIQHGRPVANRAQAVYNQDQDSKYGSVDLQLGLTAFNE